jgi:UDP-N-acetylmuramate--alanine ligase
MDFYKSMADLKRYFIEFINKVPSFGKSFICTDDKINCEIIKSIKNKNFYTYGQKDNANLLIKNIRQHKSFSNFDLMVKLPNKKNLNIKGIKIPLLGIHNIRNTVGAIGVALTVGIPIQKIKKGLKNFKGVQRRFNKIFSYNNIDFYDDYAHHPTEIRVVLQGVKQVFSKYEKICIFQPHRISRLKDLKKEFTYAFNDADTVILCPIYTAGEKIKLGFSYEDFAKKIIKNSDVKLYMVDNNNQLSKYLKQNMYGKKIVVAMGAGSISNWIKELPSLMQ